MSQPITNGKRRDSCHHSYDCEEEGLEDLRFWGKVRKGGRRGKRKRGGKGGGKGGRKRRKGGEGGGRERGRGRGIKGRETES